MDREYRYLQLMVADKDERIVCCPVDLSNIEALAPSIYSEVRRSRGTKE